MSSHWTRSAPNQQKPSPDSGYDHVGDRGKLCKKLKQKYVSSNQMILFCLLGFAKYCRAVVSSSALVWSRQRASALVWSRQRALARPDKSRRRAGASAKVPSPTDNGNANGNGEVETSAGNSDALHQFSAYWWAAIVRYRTTAVIGHCVACLRLKLQIFVAISVVVLVKNRFQYSNRSSKKATQNSNSTASRGINGSLVAKV